MDRASIEWISQVEQCTGQGHRLRGYQESLDRDFDVSSSARRSSLHPCCSVALIEGIKIDLL